MGLHLPYIYLPPNPPPPLLEKHLMDRLVYGPLLELLARPLCSQKLPLEVLRTHCSTWFSTPFSFVRKNSYSAKKKGLMENQNIWFREVTISSQLSWEVKKLKKKVQSHLDYSFQK